MATATTDQVRNAEWVHFYRATHDKPTGELVDGLCMTVQHVRSLVEDEHVTRLLTALNATMTSLFERHFPLEFAEALGETKLAKNATPELASVILHGMFEPTLNGVLEEEGILRA